MAELLTISNLLALLDIDTHWESYRLVSHCDALRRRRRYSEAIHLGEMTIRLVRNNLEQLGVALLYVCHARADSGQAEHMRQAIRDCDRAIRALNLRLYNQSIALMIRGLIGIMVDEKNGWAETVCYVERARRQLEGLIQYSIEHRQVFNVTRYQKVQQEADRLISQALEMTQRPTPVTLAASPQTVLAPAQLPMPNTPANLKPLSVPVRVIWPPNSDRRLDLSPTPEEIGEVGYIETGSMSIDGRPYQVELLNPQADAVGMLRLYGGKSYLAIPLAETSPERYAVVRVQHKPDRKWQYIIIEDVSNHLTWLDQAESVEPFKHVHIVGLDRHWVIEDNDQISLSATLRVLGVIEAILVPITEHSSAELGASERMLADYAARPTNP